MTQNQIAYQQNKLREQENAIKAREAAVKEGQQRLAESEHIQEYGFIEVPNKKAYHNYGDAKSATQMGAKSMKNIHGGAEIVNSAGSLIKALLPSGGFLSFAK